MMWPRLWKEFSEVAQLQLHGIDVEMAEADRLQTDDYVSGMNGRKFPGERQKQTHGFRE